MLHHISEFWFHSNNWVEPKNFDTLITVIIAIYLIITFVPDFVKYFKVTRYKKIQKDRMFLYKKLNEILPEYGEENKSGKDLFLKVYSDYLTRIDWSLDYIEMSLHNVWKKHIFIHILVLIICFVYLFFSANYNLYYEIHRWKVSISILILLIPFFSAVYCSFKEINKDIKNIEDHIEKIREISKNFSDNGIKGVFEFMTKNYAND